ncbi:YbdD/YjiX family protein [Tardiphaga sp. vice352]|jgi:uncharacterized short protein YbdD (DUF466 family)|uniref:YbdD/YjiX family protein n=1 Tax=unclassified Tardiphaga TaxID=2631404 RepID=UPI001163553A|nr:MULTISPECIES: YbdD/YjiX family protein [unclassified Tardiphaga]QDM14514.1 YbdD/YjiX family protein [Tardiphaga sp. vice278]QDM19710.1 YbdD/YjiX family protein [Tardiphaga sp. vice154]QDM24711.1 YbdD/YjiX family protein [Tardiphaga sp. vice304]QDM29903.1 YbdD/YjiX family protein [Tardiphaga sp. vice352]
MGDVKPSSDTTLRGRFRSLSRCFCDSALLMVGMPNYDNYVAHVRATHPDGPVMTYEEFFRDRQDARYGGGGRGGFRCC